MKAAQVLLFSVAVFGHLSVLAAPPLTPEQAETEAKAGYDFTHKNAPQGFVAILGGARWKPGDPGFESARTFAYEWTSHYGTFIPVATGGGPGVMLAANLGARQALGPSLAFTVPYPDEIKNTYATATLTFTDNGLREAALIDNARVYVAFPGGTGTHWELAEALTKIEYGRVFPHKVICVGTEQEWANTFRWLHEVLGPRFEERVQLVPQGKEAFAAAEVVARRELYYETMRPKPLTAGQLHALQTTVDYRAPEGYVAVLGSAPRGRLAEVKGTPLRPTVGNTTLTLDATFVGRAKAIYAYPGDIRTHWQLLSVIDRIAHNQMKPIPIILVGSESEWAPFKQMLGTLEAKGSAPSGVSRLFTIQPRAGASGCPFHELIH